MVFVYEKENSPRIRLRWRHVNVGVWLRHSFCLPSTTGRRGGDWRRRRRDDHHGVVVHRFVFPVYVSVKGLSNKITQVTHSSL